MDVPEEFPAEFRYLAGDKSTWQVTPWLLQHGRGSGIGMHGPVVIVNVVD